MSHAELVSPGEETATPIHARHAGRVSLSEIVDDVLAEAERDAQAGGFGLAVAPAPRDVYVDADPQALAGAVAGLVHSAFEHSPTHGHVSLTTTATADHVLIEVEDERGGLPPSEAEALLPLLEAESAACPHTGFGLAVGRRSVEAMGGRIRVRDLPGKGCVFSIDLPRQAAP
jgi:signal transduction histidine kinase